MTGSSRDRAIERLLAVPARRPAQEASGPCVDAETVAAWLDGGVMGPAAERFEAHVAACGSCQELLATVVRMMPVEAPLLQAVPRRPWTAWALPLAAAAGLVLAVWTSWPGSSRSTGPSALKEESRLARAETPAPSAQSAQPPAAPAGVPEPAETLSPSAPQAVSPRKAASSPTVADRANASPSAVAPAPLQAPPAERREREARPDDAPTRQFANAADSAADKLEVQKKADGEAKSVAPPSPAAPTSAAEAAAPRADAPAQAAASEARAKRASGVAALVGAAGASQTLRDAAAARVTVQAPGAAWRWRVDRTLEYSPDGGATWKPSSGTTAAQVADILAGASPAPQTAWFVGRRGLVLVTTDGVRLEVRRPPAPVDLVAVQASDRQAAVVRTAAGESWRTADGGRTWIAAGRIP